MSNFQKIRTGFIGACKNGNIEKVQEWLEKYPPKPKTTDQGFTFGDAINATIDKMNDMCLGFRHACGCGHLEMAKWLWSLDEGAAAIIRQFDKHCVEGFYSACINGHVAVLEWIHDVCFPAREAYLSTQRNSSLYLEAYKHQINKMFYEALSNAILFGRLAVAQWVISVKPDMLLNDYNGGLIKHWMFKCNDRNLETIQWLIDVGKIDASDFSIHAFVDTIITTGQLKTAKWFHSMYPEFLPSLDDMTYEVLFDKCDRNSRSEMKQWLLEIKQNKK